jgi:hypothetical protein
VIVSPSGTDTTGPASDLGSGPFGVAGWAELASESNRTTGKMTRLTGKLSEMKWPKVRKVSLNDK